MNRKTYKEIFDALKRILEKLEFAEAKADLCARLFAETTRDGIYSHGVNRFPRFVKMIQNGSVDVSAAPEIVTGFNALERWDGKGGAGNTNAFEMMNRALELARNHGVGAVALRNTNHWMRGGTYGWQAADAGMIGICWTNTLANLPPWGASEARLGNNPLVIAVPRAAGHVVLDMAMSQFSYGALANYRTDNKELPVDGGFDENGNLTRDAAAIEKSARPLPIGFWKGSGLSLVLDMIAAMLAGGLATHQIPLDPERETGISQTFIAINLSSLDRSDFAANLADQIIEHLQTSDLSGETVRYPGEKTLQTRLENMEKGIPVDPAIWAEILAMSLNEQK